MHMCPVCGYLGLSEEPYDHNNCASYEICPCCGFEFGFDDGDQGQTFEHHRTQWLSDGAKWFSEKKRPPNWDLDNQLKNLS